ncbi:MAG: putative sulfate exporter family transporter, partial [Candidatus Hydrogenedentes bacterium]|nr:putative sulfate exporter family transporter [Candidatus Hydrogenedentota bacterium]
IAFLQATLVSTVTWLAIFLAATKLFKLEPQFGAVMGAGGSVCGVSASIAVGAAVKARKEHIAISISLVTVWAIIMIFLLPLFSRVFHLETAVAGAWIGTSEFADAAGFAAAAAYAPQKPEGLEDAVRAVAAGNARPEQADLASMAKFYDTENAIRAFTLMKVIGRDIWIGIWCFILAIVAVVYWERRQDERSARVGAAVIWERFPKFVLGFVAASVVMTIIVKACGAESGDAFKNLGRDLITPITTLRTWTFVFAFLCIGLTTRFKELTKFGWEPFWAFTIGVLINVPLGFFLSVFVFKDFWLKIE